MRDFIKDIAKLSPEKRALLEKILLKKRSDSAENRITRRKESDPCPLSFFQESIWLMENLYHDVAMYNIPSTFHISGNLDINALQKTLNAIVSRHESLRTTFSTVDGAPVQIVSENRTVDLPIIDLSSYPKSDREAEVQLVIRREAFAKFDLSRDLMLRARLLKLDKDEYILLIVIHHIASDEWSKGIFLREFRIFYKSFNTGMPPELPDLPVQYSDFAIWQRKWLQGDVYEELLLYWKNQLKDAPPVLEFYADRPRPLVRSYEGARNHISFSESILKSLERLGSRENATLFMTLLAAYSVLLYRHTGQEDIVIGSPMANRSRVEVENLIGFFVNMLALRIDLSGDPGFTELLRRVREVCLDAYDHQDMPFEKLVEELNPERSLSYNPIFQAILILQNASKKMPLLPGIAIKPLSTRGTITKFDLFLSMSRGGQGLTGGMNYSVELFDEATVDRMGQHFYILLEGIASNPEARISELPLLTNAERRQILVEWNDTQADYPDDRCIHQLFEERAEDSPESVAVVLGDQQLTYAELNTRANQLAHYLREQGVAPDMLVGVYMERSLEMVIAILGVLKAGGAYMPLDLLYPEERIAFMIQDARPHLVITQESLLAELPKNEIEAICIDSNYHEIANQPRENPSSGATSDNLAYVMYTSGSTGKPKGVETCHKGVTRLLFGVDYVHLDESQTLLQMAPMSFDASTFELWGALLHGGKCVVYPDRIPTTEKLKLVIREHGINTLWLTASLFNMVIDEDPEVLSSVRQLIIGGEALSVDHVRRALDLLPSTQIINGYGPTESTTFACCYVIPGQLDDSINSIPIGRPIKNTQVYILDQFMNPVPIGVPGELHIAGAGLARGYLRRPELTTEKFIPNPFSDDPKSRLYKTGDQARYLPDGNIEFLGRLDHQVKIRGFRVELGEIEAMLNQHPDVRESVVMAYEDTSVSKSLVGYVVMLKGKELIIDELRGFLRRKLPDYMIPSNFISMDDFPLTPTGKIDRRALPSRDQWKTEVEYEAPKTETQKKVAKIWEEVLGLKKISINESFFDLGGHSLMAIRIISRLRSILHIELSLQMLFESPTVAGLSELIDIIEGMSEDHPGKRDTVGSKREEGEI